MGLQGQDPIRGIAEQVAYCFAHEGYAFVEDDKVEALADALQSFLKAAGIPTREVQTHRHLAVAGPTSRFV